VAEVNRAEKEVRFSTRMLFVRARSRVEVEQLRNIPYIPRTPRAFVSKMSARVKKKKKDSPPVTRDSSAGSPTPFAKLPPLSLSLSPSVRRQSCENEEDLVRVSRR
jgi:hypothetical protein